ncbi:MAG: 30S ribosomal protein S12 methylthiotransferase RimO [Clostridia bacterium]|nr:30S ribosomal protein S12 methylthiotransferase RimO [Clostridia bacterium]
MNKQKKIGFVSLGCAKNLTDTETMLGILDNAGYAITADPADAEIIVVNTCGFIDSAKEESINTLLEMAQYKEGKCELLVAAGCLAQRYSGEIEEQLPEVDIIIGTSDYGSIAAILDEYYNKGEKQTLVGDPNRLVSDSLPRIRSTPRYSAYLKIADGCDNHCTYCIIPQLRGKFHSRDEESILAEARAMAAEGVKELILVAQDTAYYGMDSGTHRLPGLLRSLSEIDGIEWIRLQYCYPENITDGLVEEIASNPKVVKYLDMPLQHVSDNVLKRMGRRSRNEEIKELINKLRSAIPGLVIRTSLIVGFPGETEEDFETLLSFIGEYRLNKVGVFTYSPEEGTPACSYDGQIDEEIAVQRRSRIMELQRDVSSALNAQAVGSTISVIIEGYDEDEFCYVGRSSTDTPEVDGIAYVYSEDELEAGQIVAAVVIDYDEYDVICKISTKG